MGAKIRIISSAFSGFFKLVRKPAKKVEIDQYKIKCENCYTIILNLLMILIFPSFVLLVMIGRMNVQLINLQ